MSNGSNTFTEWLYRPYIDLGEWRSSGNPQTHSLALAAKDLKTDTVSNTRVHGTAPPSLRREILKSLGKPEYNITDLSDLRVDLQTEPWKILLHNLGHYWDLPHFRKMKTLWLLHKMSLHDIILRYEPKVEGVQRSSGAVDDDMDLCYMRGLAKIAINIDGGDTDFSELEYVSEIGKLGSWAHVESTYTWTQANLKVLSNISQAERALAAHRASIDASGAEGHERNKLLSRYHRIYAFLPQLAGDFDEMTAQMDLAQEFCDRMGKDAETDYAEWSMLCLGALESRIKEFLLRGDLQEALSYAEQLVRHAPSDPRARMELGQVLVERNDLPGAVEAYRYASLLGPQVRSVSEFMIGQCLELMDKPFEARDAYIRSIESDPLAISPVERLVCLTDIAPGDDLKTWAASHLADLEAYEIANDSFGDLKDYQVYDGMLGRNDAVDAMSGA